MKALDGAFSGQYGTSRRLVDTFILSFILHPQSTYFLFVVSNCQVDIQPNFSKFLFHIRDRCWILIPAFRNVLSDCGPGRLSGAPDTDLELMNTSKRHQTSRLASTTANNPASCYLWKIIWPMHSYQLIITIERSFFKLVVWSSPCLPAVSSCHRVNICIVLDVATPDTRQQGDSGEDRTTVPQPAILLMVNFQRIMEIMLPNNLLLCPYLMFLQGRRVGQTLATIPHLVIGLAACLVEWWFAGRFSDSNPGQLISAAISPAVYCYLRFILSV